MPKILHIQQFLEQGLGNCVIDVRTPKEFEQGHITNALNIPLFNNEERAIVGTLYKQEGKQPAILKGLELVGPKMAAIVLKAQTYAVNNTVFVYCWRGGMRSGSVAWLLKTYGFNVFVLKGGYKTFRSFALGSFDTKANIVILGGKSGSGKTHVLQQLKLKGAQIIDLEKLAKHKGSAFGALGETTQLTQEQFENDLACELLCTWPNKTLWLEDESRLIGQKCIPTALWDKMRAAPVININIPFEKRVENLIEDYGKFPKSELQNAILKITKRLGNQQTKQAIEALNKGDLKTVCEVCLAYYDKTYHHGLETRKNPTIKNITCEAINFENIANQLLKEEINEGNKTNRI